MKKKIIRNIKRYKIIYLIDIVIIIFIFLFPMKELKTNYNSTGSNRTGFIIEKNIILKQQFLSEIDNIERIILMISTMDKNENCKVNFRFYNNQNDMIFEQSVENSELSRTTSTTDSDTSLFYFYFDNKQYNTFNTIYSIEIDTNCDSIIKIQYYDGIEKSKNAIYNGIQTDKVLALGYSGTKSSSSNFLYPIFIIIMTLIIVLGGKNEKK